MRIVHIFIKDYKAIKNLNIPIDGGHDCIYEDKFLKLSKKKNHLVDYYDGVNISAIIGKNGTGKSTILSFLETLFSTSSSIGIVVFFCEDKQLYIVCPINMNISHDSISIIEPTPNIRSFDFKVIDNPKHFIIENKIRLILVNNLSSENELLTLNKRKDIKSIINLDLHSNLKSKKRREEYFRKLLSYFKNITNFEDFHEKIYFELSFISSSEKVLERIEDYLQVDSSSNFDTLKQLEKLTLFENNTDCHNELVGLNSLAILSYLSKQSHPEFKNQHLILLYLTDIFSRLMEYHSGNGCIGMSNHNLLKETIRSLYFEENWPKSIVDNFKLREGEQEVIFAKIDVEQLERKLELILDILLSLSRLLRDHWIQEFRIKENEFTIEHHSLVIEIASLIHKLPNEIANNIKFGWHGVSTGELAHLHIFSEIFHYFSSNINSKYNNLLIIDEADLFLHPEWQRDFVSKLINLLRYCAELNKSFSPQIIFTTHSPIISGDLLPEDIVSLAKDDSGKIKTNRSFGFGTDISSLYLEGMHLEAVFGSHSKKHIDRIIRNAKNNKLDEFDKELIKRIRNPNIRGYLLGLEDD